MKHTLSKHSASAGVAHVEYGIVLSAGKVSSYDVFPIGFWGRLLGGIYAAGVQVMEHRAFFGLPVCEIQLFPPSSGDEESLCLHLLRGEVGTISAGICGRPVVGVVCVLPLEEPRPVPALALGGTECKEEPLSDGQAGQHHLQGFIRHKCRFVHHSPREGEPRKALWSVGGDHLELCPTLEGQYLPLTVIPLHQTSEHLYPVGVSDNPIPDETAVLKGVGG